MNKKFHISFNNSIFKDYSSFSLSFKKYYGKLYFNKIKALPGSIIYIDVEQCKESEIFFKDAFLENMTLEYNLNEDALIDFNGAWFKGINIKRMEISKHIIQERKKNFYEAKEVYLLLKNNFHIIGKYEDESWAFIKEKDMEKNSKTIVSILKKNNTYDLYKKIL